MISQINQKINLFVWGTPTLCLFILCGAYFTYKLKFIQIRKFKFILKNTFLSLFKPQTKKTKEKHSLSLFGSFSASLAATIGTGSIVGVATALSIGGSGAIFWMWISAFFGMAISYAENVLGILYRPKNPNDTCTGAMAYMQKGVKKKWLAKIFAVFTILASLGMGNMAQSNSVSNSLNKSFNLNESVCGIALAILTVILFIGGKKIISKVCEGIVPFMTIFFLLGSIIIIIINYDRIIPSILSIFTTAFGGKELLGGAVGVTVKSAISVGIRRGVFSNEAGLGTTVSVHTSSEVKEPVVQGAWSIFEVFIDTMVICTVTALVIMVSGVSVTNNEGSEIIVLAFESGLGSLGGYFVAISITLFAVATLVGWLFIGMTAFKYAFSNRLLFLYKILFVIFVYLGSVSSIRLVFDISDTFNGLMAIPNLISILILRKEVLKETKRYFNSCNL